MNNGLIAILAVSLLPAAACDRTVGPAVEAPDAAEQEEVVWLAVDPHGKQDPAQRTNHVVEAVKSLTDGRDVATAETKPYGCSVKYKS